MKSGDPSKSLGALTIARISSRKPRFHYTVAAMTHTEFLNMRTAVALPIVLADGRVGLCNHWTATEIVVDVYGDGSHAMETERVPFADVVVRGPALPYRSSIIAAERVRRSKTLAGLRKSFPRHAVARS